MTTSTAAADDEAQQLRDVMTDKLLNQGAINSPRIESAFRSVPRHAFARPGTPLEECYRGCIVRNKKDADGATLSSVSSAWLQARMLAQAGIDPGRVFWRSARPDTTPRSSPRSPDLAGGWSQSM